MIDLSHWLTEMYRISEPLHVPGFDGNEREDERPWAI
jgi:endogenous inhibitor of DNA gyrase (YacG/DUF329 family)